MADMTSERGEVMSQINVTPLVDVLLVLLLVLMVSASAAVARAMDVNLPSAATGSTQVESLTLRVDREGTWWLGERRLDRATLRAHLHGLGAPDKISVVLSADGAAAHRHVIALMDVLRAEHISKVAFAVLALDDAP